MRCLIATLAGLGLALVAAPGALAHATLDSSVPAAEAVLDAAPGQLRLRFSNRVVFPDDAVDVLDARGQPVAVEFSPGAGRELTATLPAGLTKGSYAVGWRVTDDHGSPVTGALNFHVGEAPAQPAVPAAPRAERTASDELRDLASTGLIVGLVALLSAAVVFAARRRRPEAALALTAGQTALACSALAAAGLLAIGGDDAQAPPPAPGSHDAQLASGSVAEVNITPPRVGAPRFTVDVRAANGQPDFGLERVVARLTHTARDLGPYTIELPKRQLGRFEPELLSFPFPGRWRIELSIERGDFDAERVVFDQEISR